MKKIIPVMLCMLIAAPAMASEELAKAKNCATCHSVAKKIVGPGYKEIAAKRAGEKGAEAALAAKITGVKKNALYTMALDITNQQS
jgi:cytochrome c